MGYVRKQLAVYAENEDMITIGAYVKGSSAEVDEAIERRADVLDFLQQEVDDRAPIGDTLSRLGKVAGISIDQAEVEVAAGGSAPRVARPVPPPSDYDDEELEAELSATLGSAELSTAAPSSAAAATATAATATAAMGDLLSADAAGKGFR